MNLLAHAHAWFSNRTTLSTRLGLLADARAVCLAEMDGLGRDPGSDLEVMVQGLQVEIDALRAGGIPFPSLHMEPSSEEEDEDELVDRIATVLRRVHTLEANGYRVSGSSRGWEEARTYCVETLTGNIVESFCLKRLIGASQRCPTCGVRAGLECIDRRKLARLARKLGPVKLSAELENRGRDAIAAAFYGCYHASRIAASRSAWIRFQEETLSSMGSQFSSNPYGVGGVTLIPCPDNTGWILEDEEGVLSRPHPLPASKAAALLWRRSCAIRISWAAAACFAGERAAGAHEAAAALTRMKASGS